MTFITLPRTLVDGTVALASHVMDDLNAIVTVVNGQLDNSNLRSNAGLTTDKIADLAITDAKLASDSVTTIKILDENVTAAKLADDDTAGLGCNLSELFVKADGTTLPTNVNAGRNQHGGKTIWVYGAWIAATSFPLMIDDSIDWRKRIITVRASVQQEAAAHKDSIPGGGVADLHTRVAHDGEGLALEPDISWGMFYSEAGQSTAAPQTPPNIQLQFDGTGGTGTVATVRFFADVISGDLYMDATVPIVGTSVEMLAQFDVSPECE